MSMPMEPYFPQFGKKMRKEITLPESYLRVVERLAFERGIKAKEYIEMLVWNHVSGGGLGQWEPDPFNNGEKIVDKFGLKVGKETFKSFSELKSKHEGHYTNSHL